jgi:hypothetical protein
MIALVRSELYRLATIRSSAVCIALLTFLAALSGWLSVPAWSLFAGVSAFFISVFTIAQHHQHRTIVLLYLARPKRLRVLAGQLLTTVLVAEALTVVSGVTVLVRHGNTEQFGNTLTVVPVMAVFGAAVAAAVRRISWLLAGFAAWFILVEGLIGKLDWLLPITTYLKATQVRGDAFNLEVFVAWTIAAVGVAMLTVNTDLSGD